jgi:AraC-like DNA-binding protein
LAPSDQPEGANAQADLLREQQVLGSNPTVGSNPLLLWSAMRVTWMTENALFLLPALRRARDLIDRDYAEPLDLDAMARVAGYSRFHFARAFAAAYGETPRAYLTRRRIERAKTLLRTANLSVTEICFLVGFASLGSFSARFRLVVGRSPSEYRGDAVARTGVPPIPGCMVLMWTRPHPDREQSGRSREHPGSATVPRERQTKEHR